jgi:hypothetical protein
VGHVKVDIGERLCDRVDLPSSLNPARLGGVLLRLGSGLLVLVLVATLLLLLLLLLLPLLGQLLVHRSISIQ